MILSRLEPIPPDPIFELSNRFAADPRPEAINLGIGVYRDDTGSIPVMDAIRRAALHAGVGHAAAGYAPILGQPAFRAQVAHLVLGRRDVPAVQAPGGTGALVLAMRLLRRAGVDRILLPRPTWANHRAIAAEAGLEVGAWTHLDANDDHPDLASMEASLAQARPGDAVLVHACCHNPTGIDLQDAQWSVLARRCRERGIVLLVDAAYLGLAGGLDADLEPLRRVVADVEQVLIAASFSKIMGLYGERVGALLAPGAGPAALGHLERLARTSWSNPPRYGAELAAAVLSDDGLTREWRDELETMRERIHGNRERLGAAISDASPRAADRMRRGRGMFGVLPLPPGAVTTLAERDGVHLLPSGRVNVAAIPSHRIDDVARSLRTAFRPESPAHARGLAPPAGRSPRHRVGGTNGDVTAAR